MRSIFAACLAMAPTAGDAQDATEAWLEQAPVPGFVVGHQVSDGSISMEERIPAGETVHQWSKMITTQRLGNIAFVGALGFATRLSAMWSNSCSGAQLEGPTILPDAGADAVELRADCPLNVMTGKPETMFMRALTGATDIHVVQVAFRHAPSAQDVAWARKHLASVVLCPVTNRAELCKKH